MTSTKVYYFDMFGRAEVLRLTLAASGVAFDDVRFDCSAFTAPHWTGNASGAEWMQMKGSSTPYGQLPLLEINGGAVRIAQSRACERFVAAGHGLLGRSAWEGAEIESMCEFLRDIYERWVQLFAVPRAEQAAARAQFVQNCDFSPLQRLAPLEQTYLVGEHLSLADLTLLNLLLEFEFSARGALDDNKIAAWCKARRERVAALPNIATYLSKRPNREF
jgi:glutathione S-transferase